MRTLEGGEERFGQRGPCECEQVARCREKLAHKLRILRKGNQGLLTSDSPDPRRCKVIVEKLESWTGLECGSLSDDGLCHSCVTVDEHL